MSVRLVVFDLDNTLYDWVSYFVGSFYELVDRICELSSIDREVLLDELRAVHQLHSDTEHPLSFLETPSVQSWIMGMEESVSKATVENLIAFYQERKSAKLRLYPNVQNTLLDLKNSDVRLVAFTDSKYFSAAERLSMLGISSYFEHVYCRRRSQVVEAETVKMPVWYTMKTLKNFRETDSAERKPSPSIIYEIMARERVEPKDTVLVGDSLSHDVAMASAAGITSVWAKYGTVHRSEDYEKLVRVSHWTSQEVEREARLRESAEGVSPNIVLENELSELVSILGIKNEQPIKAGRNTVPYFYRQS